MYFSNAFVIKTLINFVTTACYYFKFSGIWIVCGTRITLPLDDTLRSDICTSACNVTLHYNRCEYIYVFFSAISLFSLKISSFRWRRSRTLLYVRRGFFKRENYLRWSKIIQPEKKKPQNCAFIFNLRGFFTIAVDIFIQLLRFFNSLTEDLDLLWFIRRFGYNVTRWT